MEKRKCIIASKDKKVGEAFRGIVVEVPDLREWRIYEKQQIDEFIKNHTLYEEQWIKKNPEDELETNVAVQVAMDQIRHRIFEDPENVEIIEEYGILEWAKTGEKIWKDELESVGFALSTRFIDQLMEYIWEHNKDLIAAEFPECKKPDELNEYCWIPEQMGGLITDYIYPSVDSYTTQDFLKALQIAV